MDSIYADYAATTPLDKRVLEAMMPYMTDVFYNAASSHALGMQAQHAVMKSRMEIAAHIGAKMNEIVFTSGATEAINLAILGAARAAQAPGGSGRSKIVTVHSEHAAVRDSAEYCAEHGIEVIWLSLDSEGRIDLDAAARSVDGNTILLCVMSVNNETGVMQDLKALSGIAHAHGALFMTDATQAFGKVPLNVDELGIDLMTFSAHKIYGPKGVGALFARARKDVTCALEPLMFGGGQERGMRSGTMNVPGIVGLAAAASIALTEHDEESKRIGALRERFETAMKALPNVSINGSGAPRSYNISNVCFCGVEADMLLIDLPHIACSKGSACSSAKPKPSPVLVAMGRSEADAHSSLRFSFGRFTTEEEVDRLIHDVSEAHRGVMTNDE
ncbi:MAG: cysteine desulfurase family protein [Candidatus Kapabacteria bacterium]|nr:cysteine desulfurase family protein [Candidatus Kapabacteria bacterium]